MCKPCIHTSFPLCMFLSFSLCTYLFLCTILLAFELLFFSLCCFYVVFDILDSLVQWIPVDLSSVCCRHCGGEIKKLNRWKKSYFMQVTDTVPCCTMFSSMYVIIIILLFTAIWSNMLAYQSHSRPLSFLL